MNVISLFSYLEYCVYFQIQKVRVIFQTFFYPTFFCCYWLLHRWNGFYTWSQSKISLLSPLMIGSKLTFISSSGPPPPKKNPAVVDGEKQKFSEREVWISWHSEGYPPPPFWQSWTSFCLIISKRRTILLLMISISGWRFLIMIFRRRTFENHHLYNFGSFFPCQDPWGAQLASFNHY